MAQRYATAKSDTTLVYFKESNFLINERGTIAVTVNTVIQNLRSRSMLSWLLMPASDVMIYSKTISYVDSPTDESTLHLPSASDLQ